MEITSINTESLSRMFLAGAKNLEAKKEWINELNVFPVPDGDTGTNMSMTIMSAAREVGALSNPTMKELAKAISSGSLRGARGNSGVILSQLFRGFCKVIKEYDEVDVSVLCDAFQKAVETAADKIPAEITPEEIARREDFRKVTTFTIDPKDAKDFDDALSIRPIKDGLWEVGVHIADVTHYVKEGGIIDKEAEKRATSVYLVDRTIPMLPERLCNFI